MKLWRFRIIVKILISRLPLDYKYWSSIGLFRHGAMDDLHYAWRVLNIHTKDIGNKNLWKGLEIGPGDSLLSAFLAPALGARSLTMVDSGDFAHKNEKKYCRQISQFLKKFPDKVLPEILNNYGVDRMLSSVGGSYYTHGITSLKELKSSSYDLIYSQAVLEHVRHDEFESTMQECFRLLKSDGVMSHEIDFKDHLGGGLNNMRFSTKMWEKDWFAAGSGFYTNRLRMPEIISICEKVGFLVEVRNFLCWDVSQIKRKHLAKEFNNLTDYDLSISKAHLIMTIR